MPIHNTKKCDYSKRNRNYNSLSTLLHYEARIGLLVKMKTIISMHLANNIMKELKVYPPYSFLRVVSFWPLPTKGYNKYLLYLKRTSKIPLS